MSGKLIVLTGVTRGCGRALAEEFIRLGHTVIACGRSKPMIDELAKKYPKPHHFSVVDVTQAAEVEVWAQSVLKEHSAPDFLINNAAVMNRSAPLWQQSEQEFSTIIDVNIKGVANIIRSFVPAMIQRKSGVIVNFSSGWGHSVSPDVAPYCATKWAIEGLSKALAMELPSGMACFPLNPGIIHTDMLESCFGKEASGYPKPDRWAKEAAPFILSLNSKHSGQSVDVPTPR